MSRQRRENQAARAAADPGRATRGQPLTLTEDECLCLLAAGCCSLADPGELLDADDRTSVKELRSALLKLARSVGMTIEELHTFAAVATGRAPSAAVVNLVTRETH